MFLSSRDSGGNYNRGGGPDEDFDMGGGRNFGGNNGGNQSLMGTNIENLNTTTQVGQAFVCILWNFQSILIFFMYFEINGKLI